MPVRSFFRTLSSTRIDQHRKTVDAVSEFIQAQRRQVPETASFLSHVTETRALHLRGGSAESFATYGVHVNEAKCLRERYPISSAVQELDLRLHLPKHGVQTHVGQRSLRDRALRKDGRTSGKGEPLNHSNKLRGVDGK